MFIFVHDRSVPYVNFHKGAWASRHLHCVLKAMKRLCCGCCFITGNEIQQGAPTVLNREEDRPCSYACKKQELRVHAP
jgi:hypothetical protein